MMLKIYVHTRVLSCLHLLSLAFAQGHDQEIKIPYCNDVLFGFSVSDRKISYDEDIYDINHKFTSNEATVESCRINSEHSLHIPLHKLVEISDIAVDNEMYKDNDEVYIFATRNISSRHHVTISCKRNGKVKNLIDGSDSRTFTTFNCKKRPKVNTPSMNVAVDSIHIKSNQQSSIRLVKDGSSSLSILALVKNRERCLTPGYYFNQYFWPSKDRYSTGDNVTYNCSDQVNYFIAESERIRRCDQMGWIGRPPVCRPIEKWGSPASLGSVPIASGTETRQSFTFTLKDFYGIKRIVIEMAEERNKEKWAEFFIQPLKISNATHTVQWEIKQGNCDPDCDSLELMSESDTYIDCPSCTATYEIKSDEVATIKKILIKHFSHSQYQDALGLVEDCPQIDPYDGMPVHYSEQALVASKEINELIQSQPCREGFELVQQSQNLLRCENGYWIGEVPKCKIVTCKAPPYIENAQWDFPYDGLYHIVRYRCNEGFELTDGSELARCDANTSEWIGVPACRDKLDGATKRADPDCPSVSIAIIAIICVLALIIIILSVVISSMRGGDTTTQVIKRLDEPFYIGTLKSATYKPKKEIPIYDERGSTLAVYEEQPVYANAHVLFTSGKSTKTDDEKVYASLDTLKETPKFSKGSGNSKDYASVVVHLKPPSIQ